MSGLFGLLSLGARSLSAAQFGQATAGNNAANAATKGYSRRRAQVVVQGKRSADQPAQLCQDVARRVASALGDPARIGHGHAGAQALAEPFAYGRRQAVPARLA